MIHWLLFSLLIVNVKVSGRAPQGINAAVEQETITDADLLPTQHPDPTTPVNTPLTTTSRAPARHNPTPPKNHSSSPARFLRKNFALK